MPEGRDYGNVHAPAWLLALVILFAVAPANGQFLDLDGPPVLPDYRPSLDLIRVRIVDELNEIGTANPRDSPESRAIINARRTMRRFILELAEAGRDADDVSLASALAAYRLDDSRLHFDRYLGCLAVDNAFTGSPPRLLTKDMRAEATSKLNRFAESALESL